MRWLILTAALLTTAPLMSGGPLEARETRSRAPLARPMEETPSIMVGGDEARPKPTRQRESTRSRTTRRAASRVRPILVPRASGQYESETRAINRSLSEQSQILQLQQRQQIDNNLFRQDLQRSTTPSSICVPGQIGC